MYLKEGWTVRVILPLIPIVLIGIYLLWGIDYLLGIGSETELGQTLNLGWFDVVLFFLGFGIFYFQDWLWYKLPQFQHRLTWLTIILGVAAVIFTAMTYFFNLSFKFNNILTPIVIILHFHLQCFFGIGMGRAREWSKDRFGS